MLNNKKESQNNHNNNVKFISWLSFFMNFSSSLISSNAILFLETHLNSSKEYLILVRGLSENLGNLFKIVVGILSDYFQTRHVFLILGYGTLIFVKPLFTITAFRILISVSSGKILYGAAHFIDRVLNATRDSVRDAAISESSDIEDRETAYGKRKFRACLGSCLGGLISFLVFSYFKTEIFSFQILYSLALIPCLLAVYIVLFLVKDTQYVLNKETIECENYKIKYFIDYFNPLYSFVALILGSIGYFTPAYTHNIVAIFFKQFGDVIFFSILFFDLIMLQFFLKYFTKLKKIIIDIIFIATNFIISFLVFNNYQEITWGSKYTMNLIIAIAANFFRYTLFYLYKNSQQRIEYFQKNYKSFNYLLIINSIMSLGKYSEIFIFDIISQILKLDTSYNTLFFSIYYMFLGCISYLLSTSLRFISKNKVFLLGPVSLSLCNMIIFCLSLSIFPNNFIFRLIFCMLSLIFYSIHIGSIECSSPAIISKLVTVDRLKGTALGINALFVSLGNLLASYAMSAFFLKSRNNSLIFISKFLKLEYSLGFSYFIAIIPSLLSIIFCLLLQNQMNNQDKE